MIYLDDLMTEEEAELWDDKMNDWGKPKILYRATLEESAAAALSEEELEELLCRTGYYDE